MPKVFFLILILSIPFFAKANSNEFSYDKNTLKEEFIEMDKISNQLEIAPFSYSEFCANPEFKKIDLSNTIALKPTIDLGDMDCGAFALGLCCWPIGLITVIANDDKDSNSKNSFWIGLGSGAIILSVTYVVINIYAFASFGFF